MKCQTCETEVTMPYTCPYCGGQFCNQHRLPENHACPQISRARAQRQNTVEAVMTQTGGGYNYSFNFNPQPIRTHRSGHFSPKELKHIGIAALLVVGIGFSIGFYSNILNGYDYWTFEMMAIFAVCLSASFLVHEIAHKIMAQKHGLWAEFRLTMWGAVLTLASVFLPFKMIAPGAMMISGTADRKGLLKISIAGVITNLIFSCAFFAVGFALPLTLTLAPYIYVLFFAAYINAFMALFNMIPFGVLDGYKIFSINKKVWAAAFIPSVILTILGYLLI
ncbi:MAG: AN1-type zinc finger domain-containing protein [Candidatus Bathyarchaeia archaeon]|jgi:Zn-dependent protease